ncbi:hypothetical protein Moror_12527 [Moniliophthora roreri MCA 2997]|uniref:Uncharacterized protein n=1 Tax=Moniliophthora roreri (strain MCA 2997) TaxID=1381753 RepID=V2XT27_MONRO|nr:hypothetical protein Moror_12527 [Moniliophthora roreri MCA 2997]
MPHPLAHEVKTLFLDLFPAGTSTSSLIRSPYSSSSDLMPAAGLGSRLGSRCKGSKGLNPAAVEFLPRGFVANPLADSENDDLLAKTPLASCLPPRPVSEYPTLFSDSTREDKLKWDGNNATVLDLVRSKANWGSGDLNELSRDVMWFAVKPVPSTEIYLSDIRRVVAFALDFKEGLTATFGRTVGEMFSGSLVDTSIGIFIQAWFISPAHPLFAQDHYRPVHIQMSTRLAALLAELYVKGLIQHGCFHDCLRAIMCQVHHYEGIVAMRVIVEVLGRGNSQFWKLQTANQVERGAFLGCTGTCTCLCDRGMLQNEKYIVNLDATKERFAEEFLDKVTQARLPMFRGRFSDGLKSLVIPEGAVTAKTVNQEIKDMFLRLRLRAEGRI